MAVAGLWFAALCLITLRPRPAVLTVDGSARPLDLLPFRSLTDLLFSADASTSAGQVVGNVVLFAPIGVLAPIIWTAGRAARRNALLTGVGLAVLIEFSQWAMASGRVASIDDVLLAAAGTWLGNRLGAPVMSWWIGRGRPDPDESTSRPLSDPTPGH
jgi:glycopeptide antibiotics resistance protein